MLARAFLEIERMANKERTRDGSEQRPQPLFLSGQPPGVDLIPECEVFFEDEDPDGLDEKFSWCGKNPKHKGFIPLCDFTKDHLPEPIRTDEVMDFIDKKIDLTVRIRLPYTTTARPDYVPGEGKNFYPYMHHKGHTNFTRNATGCLMSVSKAIKGECPCPPCKEREQPESEHFLLTVRTATHNVFDNDEAVLATVDCFFNRENDPEDGVLEHLYGLHLDESDGKKETMYKLDVCDLICVSHNVQTVDKISKLLSDLEGLPGLPDTEPFAEVIISHPHGCTKRISVGIIEYLAIPVYPAYKRKQPIQLPEGITKCYVKTDSGEKDEIKIPPGTTFTLPSECDYAMRYRIDSPEFFSFPPGTKFTPPTGSDIKSALLELKDETEFETVESPLSLGDCFACNVVGGCAGTGGAMVYSNLMEDEVLTGMTHTSKWRSGKLSLFESQATTTASSSE